VSFSKLLDVQHDATPIAAYLFFPFFGTRVCMCVVGGGGRGDFLQCKYDGRDLLLLRGADGLLVVR
jgi:hypothetical protein